MNEELVRFKVDGDISAYNYFESSEISFTENFEIWQVIQETFNVILSMIFIQ